jgi:hypothetical protein
LNSGANIGFQYRFGSSELHAFSHVSSGHEYHSGEPVTVVVDLQHPERAIVKGESAPASWWFGPNQDVGFGAALVLLVELVAIVIATIQLQWRRSRAKRHLPANAEDGPGR